MLRAGRCTLRRYRANDVAALPALAGPWEVARWMTPRFPHPYTAGAAAAWIAAAMADDPPDNFAIEVDGRLADGIGLRPLAEEWTGGAEFGYWLGNAYWGRGLATEAARGLTAYAFEQRSLRRLQAHVFARNVASTHVLEKCGFRREALLREAFVERDGCVADGLLYALLRRDANAPPRRRKPKQRTASYEDENPSPRRNLQASRQV